MLAVGCSCRGPVGQKQEAEISVNARNYVAFGVLRDPIPRFANRINMGDRHAMIIHSIGSDAVEHERTCVSPVSQRTLLGEKISGNALQTCGNEFIEGGRILTVVEPVGAQGKRGQKQRIAHTALHMAEPIAFPSPIEPDPVEGVPRHRGRGFGSGVRLLSKVYPFIVKRDSVFHCPLLVHPHESKLQRNLFRVSPVHALTG